MALELRKVIERTKESAFTASDVEQGRGAFASRSDGVSEGSMDGVGVTAFSETTTRFRRVARVARLFRPPVLRLQEIQ